MGSQRQKMTCASQVFTVSSDPSLTAATSSFSAPITCQTWFVACPFGRAAGKCSISNGCVASLSSTKVLLGRQIGVGIHPGVCRRWEPKQAACAFPYLTRYCLYGWLSLLFLGFGYCKLFSWNGIKLSI